MQRPITNIIICLFLAISIAFLNGCVSISPNILKEIETRRPPFVRVGPQLILQDHFELSLYPTMNSLIDSGGRAHIFFTDAMKLVHHVEVSENDVVRREVLGAVEKRHTRYTVHSVEHPAGTIRVAAGDKMFIRAGNHTWREIKENRCERFIPAGNDLLCSFIADGGDVGAPERRDWVVGWFILVPVMWWSDVHAKKLVIAQETNAGWAIRAVVDPATELSASDYVIGTDRAGLLHVLYRLSGGSYGFFVVAGAAGGRGGGGGIGYQPVRYARIPLDRLLFPSASVVGANAGIDWVKMDGSDLPWMPFVGEWEKLMAEEAIGPLSRNFTVNRENGNVHGLIWSLRLSPDAHRAWVQVKIEDGRWEPQYDIVAIDDSDWSWVLRPVVRGTDLYARITTDSHGDTHALLSRSNLRRIFIGLMKLTHQLAYFVKAGPEWSAPLILGDYHEWSRESALSVDESRRVFVAWIDKSKRVVGRWIMPE